MQLIRIGYNHDTGRNLEIWLYFLKKFQLGFSSKIEVPQLGSARLGTFIARARSSRKIPARTHLYYLYYLSVQILNIVFVLLGLSKRSYIFLRNTTKLIFHKICASSQELTTRINILTFLVIQRNWMQVLIFRCRNC
jgi:hypothetical protein